MSRLVLASASPRRLDLLEAAGFRVDVVPADVDETRWPDEAPGEHVLRLAAEKATAVRDRHADLSARPIVGADTTVVVDGRVLGKPRDHADAAGMLRALSGRTHHVLTGVAMCLGPTLLTERVTSAVTFVELSASEIEWYVASGEPMDKAGAYAIQGLASRFIVGIEGSYSNIVGLPIEAVHRLLKQLRSDECRKPGGSSA